MIKTFAAAILACLGASPAAASWRMASSEHFVIYADNSADDLERFANTLERYHETPELVTGRGTAKPSPSNRLTIYVVGSARRIENLAGCSSVAGFYRARI